MTETKNYKSRFFTITSNGAINGIQSVKKYMNLRSKHAKHAFFFVFDSQGKCSIQRLGIHKITSIPKMIATFLGFTQSRAIHWPLSKAKLCHNPSQHRSKHNPS